TLLDGFSVRLAEGFDGWLQEERARLLEEFRGKWLAAADAALQGGRVDQALAWWSSWLRVEPLDEPVVGSFLRHCRAGGRAAEGLRTFESFRTRLERELGLEPTDELVALAGDLRQVSGGSAGHAVSVGPDSIATTESSRGTRIHAKAAEPEAILPPLVGRSDELERLLHALRAPGTVVSLVAPGGMGKTRLAREVFKRFRPEDAERVRRRESAAPESVTSAADDVVFVDLMDATTVEEAAAAVASELAPGALRALPPRERARATAADRRALIVLDNVEQIVGIEEFVHDLRRVAPAASWLLTTRVAPRLPGAVTVFLGGLATPDADGEMRTLEELEAYPAARLFVDRARALGRPVDASEVGAVAELTRAVGGMPLALELAAGWSQVLALPDVHARLASDTESTVPQAADLPERHASIARVFDRTWEQLPDALRGAVLRLGIFVGGCTTEAAVAVASVDVDTIAELRRHALIEVTRSGRLIQHPVVRQYVVLRMDDEVQALVGLREAHAKYYLDLIERMEQQGQATGGTAEIATLVAEHGNIEVAWRWAIDHYWWDALITAGAITSISFASVGMVSRWLEMVNAARLRSPEGSLPWCWFGTAKTNLGILSATLTSQEAYEQLRSLMMLAHSFDHPLKVGWITFFAAQAAAAFGRRAEARAWTQDAIQLWRRAEATHLVPMAAHLAVLFTVDLSERQRATKVLVDAVERSGSPEYVGKLAALRAWDLARTWGRYPEALRLIDLAAATVAELAAGLERALVLRDAVDICIMAGELQRARTQARLALEVVLPYGAHSFIHSHVLHTQFAEATWLAGDTAAARRVLAEDIEGFGGSHVHLLQARMALAEGDVGAARSELEALRRQVAGPLVKRDDYYADVRLSCLEAAVAVAEGNRERTIASLVAALDRCIALTFVPVSLWGLAIAARYLDPPERERVLRAVAAHPATPYEVRVDPAVAAHARATSIADTARVVRAYPAMQQRVLARLRSIEGRSAPGTTAR
ncbi:MAG: BTAD domain-containing putative transcriptional regulator, partial [Trueperaceae bacterium]